MMTATSIRTNRCKMHSMFNQVLFVWKTRWNGMVLILICRIGWLYFLFGWVGWDQPLFIFCLQTLKVGSINDRWNLFVSFFIFPFFLFLFLPSRVSSTPRPAPPPRNRARAKVTRQRRLTGLGRSLSERQCWVGRSSLVPRVEPAPATLSHISSLPSPLRRTCSS